MNLLIQSRHFLTLLYIQHMADLPDIYLRPYILYYFGFRRSCFQQMPDRYLPPVQADYNLTKKQA